MSEPAFPGTEAFDEEPKVWAGGGIVVSDELLLLVHRPHYDDWTFPKGKLDPGEGLAECALREVQEETGLVCELEDPVIAVRYIDGKGRLKEVRYWMMSVLSGEFEPNDEVDEVAWVTPTDADRMLTYPRDTEVLDAALPILFG